MWNLQEQLETIEQENPYNSFITTVIEPMSAEDYFEQVVDAGMIYDYCKLYNKDYYSILDREDEKLEMIDTLYNEYITTFNINNYKNAN